MKQANEKWKIGNFFVSLRTSGSLKGGRGGVNNETLPWRTIEPATSQWEAKLRRELRASSRAMQGTQKNNRLVIFYFSHFIKLLRKLEKQPQNVDYEFISPAKRKN